MSDVQLRQLRQSFGSRRILDGLDLDVKSGEYVVLLGESGSGKTTTLRLIAGLDTPVGGSVWIGDRCVDSLPPRSRDVSMVFQNDALYPHLTVRQSIGFGLRQHLSGDELKLRIGEAAELAGVVDLLDRYPDRLSGGELRRATIAKSIARRAQVRLMDEPLSALDGAVRQALRDDLLRWHELVRGTTIHVTHEGYEAMRLADRIAVLHRGRIIQCGSPAEIYDEPAHRSVALAIGTPPINLLNSSQQTSGSCCVRPSVGKEDFEIGVRPEALSVIQSEQSPSAESGLFLSGRVRRIATIGNRDHLDVAVGSQTVLVVSSSGRVPRPGESCQLFAELKTLHFFDGQTGDRLEPPHESHGRAGD